MLTEKMPYLTSCVPLFFIPWIRSVASEHSSCRSGGKRHRARTWATVRFRVRASRSRGKDCPLPNSRHSSATPLQSEFFALVLFCLVYLLTLHVTILLSVFFFPFFFFRSLLFYFFTRYYHRSFFSPFFLSLIFIILFSSCWCFFCRFLLFLLSLSIFFIFFVLFVHIYSLHFCIFSTLLAKTRSGSSL